MPPYECATSTVAPSCSASTRRVASASSASERNGFCTAVTCRPAFCSSGMTSDQLDASAYRPCTSTTFLATTGLAVGAVVAPSAMALVEAKIKAALAMAVEMRRACMMVSLKVELCNKSESKDSMQACRQQQHDT